jgi:tripartite-type tricarboxylate transporter receptor subunit TctC
MTMRGLLLITLIAAAAGLPCPAISADAPWPQRPVRIVVPQSPGGLTDLTARLIGPRLAERLGQPVVVDNRPGAGSMVGTDLVAKAAPDGYTLVVVPSSITIIPSMYKQVPFDPLRDFAPITTLTSYPNLVVVPPSVPATSLKELIALAKAKPGALNYASGGAGTPTQLGPELFKAMAGLDIVHVPYSGGGPAITALLGGQVQLYFAPIATVLQLVKGGKLRALAVTSAKRSSVVPEVPTVAESGVPGFDQTTWNALLAPARTPPAVQARLVAELEAILKLPAIRERFAAEGVETGGIAPAQLAANMKAEIAQWARVIRDAGIKPE